MVVSDVPMLNRVEICTAHRALFLFKVHLVFVMCRQDIVVLCYSTKTIILCTTHTMIHELDKQTKNFDF